MTAVFAFVAAFLLVGVGAGSTANAKHQFDRHG